MGLLGGKRNSFHQYVSLDFLSLKTKKYGLEEVSVMLVCCWVLSDHICRLLYFGKDNRNYIIVLYMTFNTLKPTGMLSADQNKGNTNNEINIFPKIFLFNVVQIAPSRKNPTEFYQSQFSFMFEFQSNTGDPDN